ncbi:MAG TPA: flagellar motor switch protein FliM, partial [Clostridium sp.]|nr:flagellar motor switch protein FliM [Clostridium sp.]
DVITLNSNIEEPIGVYVEEQLTYSGKPGLYGKNRAVQILDFTDKDVEEDE